MAQEVPQKISQLPEATTLTQEAILPIVENGATYRIPRTWIAPEFNALSFGAVGDGVTDDSSALQSAITAASAVRGVVLLPQGTYRCLSAITVSGPLTIRGTGPSSVLDFSSATGTMVGVTVQGSQASGVPLNANATEGSETLNVPSTGFATGDWVKVYSSAVTGSTSTPKGEISRINDAATMALYDPLCDTYNTADSASVAKLTLVENVTFADFKILGPVDNSVTFSGILCDRTQGVRVESVNFEYCHFYGVAMQDSIQWSISNCSFTRSESGSLAYGIAVYNASQDGTIVNCRGFRLRHLVTHGGFSTRNGVARRIVISNCVSSQSRNSGFDVHAGPEDITFTGCSVMGSESDGFTIECSSATVTGCTVRDSVGPGVHINTQSLKPLDVTVTGCRISGKGSALTRRGIQLQVQPGYESFDNVSITGNNVADCRYGISVINAQTGRVDNLTITGNSFKRCGQNGESVIDVVHAQGVTITGNNIYEDISSTDGISLWDVLDFSVQSNTIRLPNGGSCRCIRLLTTCDRGTIDGNKCSGGVNSVGVDAASTVTNVTIGAANHLSGCTSPLILSTGSGHKVIQANEVSADKGNAAFTAFHYSEQTILFNTPITADRAFSTPSANVKMRFRVVRGAGATGAFNINVGTGPLKALGSAGTWCDIESNGTAFVLTGSGSL